MEPPGTKNGITERERKMDVKITIIGTEKALNVWTMATAEVSGKKYRIQMVRFDEPSIYGIRKGRISKLWMRRRGDAQAVLGYDRRWERGFTPRGKGADVRAAYRAIIAKFN